MNKKKHDPFPLREKLSTDIRPLIEALATGKAVAYVGAGASMAAGLPSWEQLLKECLEKACRHSETPEKWDLTRKLCDRGEYLVAAELLQKGLGSQLEQFIYEIFSSHRNPTDIHKLIARMPFSIAFTTNYERLLEAAYSRFPSVLTWRMAEAVFWAIRRRRFAVVKVHGDFADGRSLVLTKTHYRDLMHYNAAFNSCLEDLLLYRTFLFVGCSLKDDDLRERLDKARLTFGGGIWAALRYPFFWRSR